MSDKGYKGLVWTNTKRNDSKLKQGSKHGRSSAETELFNEMSSLIPVKPGVKLDKSLVLRFVIAYIKSRHIVDGGAESLNAEVNLHDAVSKNKDSGIHSSDLVPKADIDFDIPEGVVSQLHEQFLSETDSGNEQIGMFVDSYKDALERGMRDFLAGTINHSPKASDDDEEEEEGDTPDDVSSPAMKNTSSVVSTVDTFSLNPVVIRPQTIVSRHGQSHDLMKTGFATKEGWLTLKASHGLMLMLDNNLSITFVSDNVSHLLGHQAEKMLGKHIKDYMDPSDAKELDRHLKDELLNQGSKEEVSSTRRVLHFVMKYSFIGVTRSSINTGYALTQWSMIIRMKQNHVKGTKSLTGVVALCEVMKPNIDCLDPNIKMFVIYWSMDFDAVDGEWDKVRYFTGYSRMEYLDAMKYKYYIDGSDIQDATLLKQYLLLNGHMTSQYFRIRIATGEWLWMKSDVTLETDNHQLVTRFNIISESDIVKYVKSHRDVVIRRHGCNGSFSRNIGLKKINIKRLRTETDSDKGSSGRYDDMTLHNSISFDSPETVGFPAAENLAQNNSLHNLSLQETFSGSDQPSVGIPSIDTNSNHSSHNTDSDIQDWFDHLEKSSPNSSLHFSPNFRGQEVFNLSQPVSSVYSSSDLDDLILSELQTEIHADEESPGIHDSMSDNSVIQTLTSLLSSDISPSNQEINAAEGTIYQQSQTEAVSGLNLASDFNLFSDSNHQYKNHNFPSQSYNLIFDSSEIVGFPMTENLVQNNHLHNWSLQQETFSGSDQHLKGTDYVDTNFNCSSHGTDSDIQNWFDSSEKSSPYSSQDFSISPIVRGQEDVNSSHPSTVSESSDLDDLTLSDLLFFN